MPGSYCEQPPIHALSNFVECVWTRLSDPADGPTHRVLPDGCIDILLQGDADQGMRARLIGTMTRPLVVASGGPQLNIGVRFKPGGLTALLNFDACEITDGSASLSDLDPALAGSLEDLSGRPLPLGERCETLQIILGRRAAARGRNVDPYVEAIARLVVRRQGMVRVEELSEHAGISRQHLSRLFQHHVGITTKAFARIVRFRAAFQEAQRRPEQSWSQVAAALGFADQAHLIGEFRRLGGVTPGAVPR